MRIGSRALGVLLFVIAECLAFGTQKAKGAAVPAEDGKAKAGVLRLISAAEGAYFRTHERYATFPELIQSGQISATANQSSAYLRALQFLNSQSESHPIEGFALGLAITPDGRGYRLSLTQQANTCRLGWFADETGTVYEGKAVGCAEKTTPLRSNGWSPADIDDEMPPVRSEVACPLGVILHETGKRTEELVENLQRFTADERIEHIQLGRDGKPHHSTKQLVHYVAQIELNIPRERSAWKSTVRR
jgi:hypothetical protein